MGTNLTERKTTNMDPKNFDQADALLTGRCKNRRKIANNTYLERRDNGDIAATVLGGITAGVTIDIFTGAKRKNRGRRGGLWGRINPERPHRFTPRWTGNGPFGNVPLTDSSQNRW